MVNDNTAANPKKPTPDHKKGGTKHYDNYPEGNFHPLLAYAFRPLFILLPAIDEAKLLYVAMTRSTDKLLLTSHRENEFVVG